MGQLDATAKEKKHDFQLKKASDAVFEFVDAIKMTMVVENLISNAIKYTPDGGKISVGIDKTTDGTQITVQDSGIGIDPKDQQTLFSKFGRIQTDFTAKVQGTGLGLYLAKQFVELHGGSIDVQSAPGKGTSFIVKLPQENQDQNGKNTDS
jgi:signal transduction histidine kinase